MSGGRARDPDEDDTREPPEEPRCPSRGMHGLSAEIADASPVGSVPARIRAEAFRPSEDPDAELIAAVLPDVLVKGADWAHWIAGREEVEAAGGQVLALPLEPGYSTTGIVEAILSRKP